MQFICKKKCVFILTCLNFSHLQSILHLMQYTFWDFFPLLKTVFELIDFDAFLCFCCFLFHLFQNVSLWGLFSSGNKKAAWGKTDWVNREGRHKGHCSFSQKLLNTQHSVGRCAPTSPIMKCANALKESSKNKFTEAEHSLSQQLQLVHWYRWVPRTLT